MAATGIRIRLILYFYRRIIVPNMLFSLLVATGYFGLLAMFGSEPVGRALSASCRVFIESGATVGFGFGLFYYHVMRRHEYPMYRSHGLTPAIRITAAYILNTASCLLLIAPLRLATG